MGNAAGRMLIVVGLAIVAVGVIIYFRDSLPFVKHIGKLPGDIHIKRENFSFYFPLTTGIVLSVVLSLLMLLLGRFR